MAQTKQQKEIITLAVLLVIGALVYYSFFGRNPAGAAGVFQAGPYTKINAVDYGKILKDWEATRGTEYKPSGRNIFIAAPPPAPHVDVKPVEPPYVPKGPQLPPPPPPPTLEGMKFFGVGTVPAPGQRQAFLQDGDDVRIVQEGDIIRNHIRIKHIGNDRIEFEDINTGAPNSAPLEMPPQQ